MKKEAYYFSHDANAQDDPKCMILIDQMGMNGYGIFWALIEKLRAEKDFKLPVNILGSLAKRWHTKKEKVESVIKDFGLFVIEDEKYFFSQRLSNSMTERSNKARSSANKRWEDANAMRPHTERNATAMRNDANKGKESKVKEIILPFPSDKFKNYWEKWKNYRKSEHSKTYKSAESEQAALSLLKNISAGSESTALLVIDQSISQQWQGLFELKNQINGSAKTQFQDKIPAHMPTLK